MFKEKKRNLILPFTQKQAILRPRVGKTVQQLLRILVALAKE